MLVNYQKSVFHIGNPTMAQWVNLNWNNRSVIAHQYSALSGAVLLVLVGLTAGWLADKMQVDFEIFKILYRPNSLYFYFLCAFQLVFLN